MSKEEQLEKQFGANNYSPLPLVLKKGKGVYVWDEKNKRYLDMMSAYSAVSHGHCHPKIVKVLNKQSKQLCIASRAFYNDKLGAFLQKACEMTGQDKALAMNTGTEAVETALKAARKWGYEVKRITPGQAEIIACEGNFHGRSISIVGLSTEPQYRNGFGPFPDGLITIPYADHQALENAITENTAAFIVEPIQGEGGIIIPPKGYLKRCEQICKKHNVLLICDEVQTGLGRTGELLACQHDDVKPDGLILGKALGGGIFPLSLFLSKKEVMDVFTPGDHGSTFGGNPLAATVGLEALKIIEKDKYAVRSKKLGEYFMKKLEKIHSPLVKEIRGKGLFIGIEIEEGGKSARELCIALMQKGLLSKETHEKVIRLAPPLIISKAQIRKAVKILRQVL